MRDDPPRVVSRHDPLRTGSAVGDGSSVVTDGHGPRVFQFRKLGKRLPFQPRTDCGHRINPRAFSLIGLPQNKLRDLGAVIDRVGIGHGANGGKPTRCCCPATRGNGFLVFVARFPQMDMEIDQTWRHHQTGGIDNPAIGRRGFTAASMREADDLAVPDKKVGHTITMAWIDDPPAPNQNIHSYFPPSTR